MSIAIGSIKAGLTLDARLQAHLADKKYRPGSARHDNDRRKFPGEVRGGVPTHEAGCKVWSREEKC